MSILRLDIINVRNIQRQTINPSPAFNFIYGKNASGKSALIEAIFLLGRAKSFRAPSIKTVISFNQEHLIVSAQILQNNGINQHVGIQMDGKDIEIRINKQSRQQRSDLAYCLPLQIIHPKSFELLDAGAQIRREFLDWGIFNNQEQFLHVWRKYKKALLQRNAVLKIKAIDQLNVWNKELSNYGTIVNDFRNQYLQNLKPSLIETVEKFIKQVDFDLRMASGWDTNKPLEQLLIEDQERDLRDGFTHSGPHRDDFQLLVDHRNAKDVISRGQLKLLVICLKLAQVDLVFKENSTLSCILIDDFAAELDKETRAKILTYLNELKCQVFITATEKHDFGDISKIKNYQMFHMKHGEIAPEDVSHET